MEMLLAVLLGAFGGICMYMLAMSHKFFRGSQPMLLITGMYISWMLTYILLCLKIGG